MANPRSITVLHIDDDATILEFVEEFVKQAEPDMVFTSVETPNAALELLQDTKFDCIISDYKMPELNGIQLAQQIRRLTDSPIILYTGQGSEEVAEQAYSVGINDYIRKENHPAHYQVLAKRIRHVVEMKRAEKALRESEERYRALIDNSPNAISVTVGDKIVYANRRRAELTGVNDPSKLIGVSNILQVAEADRRLMIERQRIRERGVKPSSPFTFQFASNDGSLGILWTTARR